MQASEPLQMGVSKLGVSFFGVLFSEISKCSQQYRVPNPSLLRVGGWVGGVDCGSGLRLEVGSGRVVA